MATDGGWDDVALADEVARLTRAAKARINRAVAMIASGGSSCNSTNKSSRKRRSNENADNHAPRPRTKSTRRGNGQAGAITASNGCRGRGTVNHNEKQAQGRKPRPVKVRGILKVKSAASSALRGDKAPTALRRHWAKVRLAPLSRVIMVGTECSGLESVMAALDLMGLRGKSRLRFVCEKDSAARKLILAHQKPDIVYQDITHRPVQGMPTCDLYAAGFPCQPFSTAGLHEGADDRHGRGRIFPHVAEYIRQKTPKCFVLENVKGLTSKTHHKTFLDMLATLRSDGKYLVTWRVMNTADYGIPQNRPRLYVVGMLRSALPDGEVRFKWPCPTGCTPLNLLLEPKTVKREQPRRGTVAHKKLIKLIRRLDKQGLAQSSTAIALDIFAATGRAMVGRVPCLTRSRAGAGGYWITTTAGLLTTREMLRLQGLPERLINAAELAGISERQLRQMIGNAMSVNVLVILLGRLLPAMGLAKST